MSSCTPPGRARGPAAHWRGDGPVATSPVALALANVELPARVADAAIRDLLTGLWNRRHLEVSTARLFAARSRLPLDERRPIAIILFDHDHLGAFHKQHRH